MSDDGDDKIVRITKASEQKAEDELEAAADALKVPTDAFKVSAAKAIAKGVASYLIITVDAHGSVESNHNASAFPIPILGMIPIVISQIVAGTLKPKG